MNATVAKPADPEARLSRAELRLRWQQMLVDPMLADIPGKIELNERGTIELTPPNTRHGIFQAFIAAELQRSRPDGTTITECGIETDAGVRAPDVMWASAEFMSRHGTESPLPRAPELCIEVLSLSNTEPEMQQKRVAYLAAGAIEVWLVKEDGTVAMFTERGPVASSSLGIVVRPLPLPKK